MAYSIRVMYGKGVPATKRFSFESLTEANADIEFDKAVKEINKIYKETGRFDTMEEVVNHFKKYGFYRIAL